MIIFAREMPENGEYREITMEYRRIPKRGSRRHQKGSKCL